MDLAKKVLQGDEKSAARLISMIEEGGDEGHRAISLLFPHTGKAHIIGVTGTPGAGKSTLINKLAVNFAGKGKKVGIIAVDPTSSKDNGALLGDRLRMRDAEKTEGIFIRSMANRGYPGGISQATAGAVYVLEALGKEIIMVETVGAGQTDMQIYFLCNTIITILTPDYGDEIQLMKAGLLETGDIVAINKTDNIRAEDISTDIAAYICQTKTKGWQTPVLTVQAKEGSGIESLIDAINAHFVYLNKNTHGKDLKKEKLKILMFALLKEEIWKNALNAWAGDKRFEGIVKKLQKREIDPYAAARKALKITGL
ncbi:MAG: methylmalonyl Co-A mutase-associated GTPase MeaB [Proteobacteria bacterium]|nr:methylmalonyl Co-A mutase-associated GTPase MeaB [Pseudomonadota bacterium]